MSKHHGGFGLSAERKAELRAIFPYFRCFVGKGWYEEDQDWSIVALAFPRYFSEEEIYHAAETVQSSIKMERDLYGNNGGYWRIAQLIKGTLVENAPKPASQRHTPTPWLSGYFDVPENAEGHRRGFFIQPVPKGYDIAHLLVTSSQDREFQQANAEFIVKAVNAHDALINACNEALNYMGRAVPGETQDMLRAALKLAESEAL